MKIELGLKYNYAYPWYTEAGISVKGYIYDDRTGLLEDNALIRYFEAAVDVASFISLLETANGLFSVIICREGKLLMAVDRMRTFPLFYRQTGDNVRISDDAETAAGSAPVLSEEAVSEFLCAGFVSGKNTLLEGVAQLQAGSYCHFHENKLRQHFYHLFCSDQLLSGSEATLKQSLADILMRVGERLVRQLAGRPAVIPLSGGYDSRLIAVLLKNVGYKNVICYTYGGERTEEVRLSQKIAEQLGFRWHFIRHTHELIDGFIATKEFQTYFPFAANYTSSFFTQDYFAVRYLTENNLLTEDSVILPGHTGSFDSGLGTLPKITEQNVVRQIIRKHFSLRNDISNDAFTTRVSRQLIDASPEEQFENWNVKERLSKFINNANRVYEYWGYRHLIPLWDQEFSEFFRNLPIRERRNKHLYQSVCREYFFQPAQVAIFLRRYPIFIQKMMGAKNRLKRFFGADPLNFKLIARQFQKDQPLLVKWNSTTININAIQSSWYIKKITSGTPVHSGRQALDHSQD